MKILFISFVKLLLVFDFLAGQQINFGFITQNPIGEFPSEVYYDTAEEDIDLVGSDYVYTYNNTDPSSKPGFFFNYRYNLSGYYLSLGFETIGSKDGIIDQNRDYYYNGFPADRTGWPYIDRENWVFKYKEMKLSLFTLSINKEYKLNDVSSLFGLNGLPDFTNDISLYVGLKATAFNAGEKKYQNTYNNYNLISIDSLTGNGNYELSDIDEYDDVSSGAIDDFKSSSPAILLGISYKFMPDFKIFAEYSTATVNRDWEYYDWDDGDYKNTYTGSGSFSLGITYDFEMSPEEKAAKMEEKEAKQKAKREKLKKELENF